MCCAYNKYVDREDAMATASTLSVVVKPQAKLPRSLDRELGVYVLDKCREVVEEYAELSRCAPAAFPFSEAELETWYAEIRYKLLGVGCCSFCGASRPAEAECSSTPAAA
jgi:hypothetical protein